MLSIKESEFGSFQGIQVQKFTLQNANGFEAAVITYGATLVSFKTPDRDGKIGEITCQYDNMEQYLNGSPYFGSTVGRFANRIAKGKFTIDGKEYSLATNNGPNHLHGGIKGLDKRIWTAKSFQNETSVGVQFTYLSKDGEEGYPGDVEVTTIYTLSNDDSLSFVHKASTDKACPINLTNHTFWNLEGPATGSILSHEMVIHADHYIPVDSTIIPTGEIAKVEGTPMDFNLVHLIGARIEQVDGGYDHCYVLNKKDRIVDKSNESSPEALYLAARVVAPGSGRVMEIFTDQLGVQFYSGNFLHGEQGANGVKFEKHHAFCLETEGFPDAMNHSNFPNCILKPGQSYYHHTVHKFSVSK